MQTPIHSLTLTTKLAALAFSTLSLTTAQASELELLSPADQTSLLGAFDAVRYAATPTEQGFGLRTANGALQADLDGRGISVQPTQSSAWTWGLELTSFGFEGAQTVVDQAAAVHADGNRVTYNWTDSLDEWFVNDSAGLEHGFTLRTRPASAKGGALLTFDMDVRGALLPVVTSDQKSVRFIDAEGACALTYSGLVVFDAKGTQLDSSFTRIGDELRLSIDEASAVYPLTIDPMIQLAYIKAPHPGEFDFFGDSIAISGDTVVIGAKGEDSAATGVYGDQTNNSTNSAGAAYVFVRKNGKWELQAYLKAINPSVEDYFGHAVAIDGDTIVVGAPYEDSDATGVNGNPYNEHTDNAGAAYVYKRFGLTWGFDAYLKASNTGAGDNFGSAVAVEGDRIVVSAPYEDSGADGINGNQADNSAMAAGAVYLFTRTAGNWSQQLYIKASNSGTNDWFGFDLDLSGTTLVVTAPAEDSNAQGIGGNQLNNNALYSGAAYVFELGGEIPYQQAYIKASNAEQYDNFGRAVAIDGDTIVVGCEEEASATSGINGDELDNSLPYAGAAYVFVRSGSTWSQQAYLKSTYTTGDNHFGVSVDISGENIVVGATHEKSKAIGVGGDQTDTSVITAGAVFRFTRTNGEWTQSAYLKSSNTQWADRFGIAVAIDGDTVFAGASGEDSGSGSINGDQSDNSVTSAGAAYGFDLNSPCGVTQYGTNTGANYADLNMFTAPIVNQFVSFEMTGWANSGYCALMISAAPDNLPLFGGTLLVNWDLAIYGAGTLNFMPVPVDSSTYTVYVPPIAGGLTVYAQAGMFDSNAPGGFAFTNGLEVSICP